LNELNRQVQACQRDIDNIENIQGYNTLKGELLELDSKITNARVDMGVLIAEKNSIESFHGDNYIDTVEVSELYELFCLGMGELVKKELDEVIEFKKKIDEFQKSLIEERYQTVCTQLDAKTRLLKEYDDLYKSKVSVLDQKGVLKNLKQTYAIHQKKQEEFSILSSSIKSYEKYAYDYNKIKRERDEAIYCLKGLKEEANINVESIEQSIISMHENIIGNGKCSFDVMVDKSSEIVKFLLRVDSDGSHSIDREKVFLYDYALLTNMEIEDRHYGILIHDNIFDVDQDTLIKSINYILDKHKDIKEKQYILTLNRDMFSEEDIKKLTYDIETFVVARYTRSNRFFPFQYQELTRKN
jgi:uncharacterized protein YydD (DUF2326 family)